MVCAIDCGEEFNGHPKDKSQIGGRLALLSLRYVYGKKIEARSPLPQQAFLRNRKELIVRFAYAGEGLRTESEDIVITSYSIHYTKLYEVRIIFIIVLFYLANVVLKKEIVKFLKPDT